MHLEIIDQKRIDLLKTLRENNLISEFVMGGGTGLSLQLGLRISEDFNFFINRHFNIHTLLHELKDIFKNQVVVINQEEKLSTLNLFINKIKVSFFEYQYNNLNPPIEISDFKPLKIFSLEDIACMKAIAVIQRGTKKDFFDLFFIIKESRLNASSFLNLLDKKYHDDNIKLNFMLSIAYFNDADNDILPRAFVSYSWDEIKKFFVRFQKEIKKIL